MMRYKVLKSNTETLPRPKRRRQRPKSWPITFSPFARSLVLARMHSLHAPKRRSQNPNPTLPAKEPQPAQSSHHHLNVRLLIPVLMCFL